ncbi:heterocyst frequency control protein PatD [Roseofilum capinflatum]|uniref:Heterocyst frequency control protein PatD n=1 Tax=Roseofilum capinflatum BLCC-M114 TaxID=3022440 RepID=A0ABT7BAZ1_9CYAN|nr:heterocyst frequency control protein PatD [Roseofilum capinflatum]MDJ1176337.1 heterocyst frequency control protein PatD [Roseofilum capinflatum BLCC-M114]
MLSKEHMQIYQNFLDILKEVLILSTTETTPDLLIPTCQEVEDFFGQQIAPLSWDQNYPVSEMAWQSIQTEMHKQIKLLVTETTFYQMSRQESAQQQRKKKISHYTQALIRYCEILLGTGD